MKVSSRLNCPQTVSLWPDWSASFDGKDAGATAKGFAGSDSKLVNNSKSSSLFRTGQHFFIRSTAKYGTTAHSATEWPWAEFHFTDWSYWSWNLIVLFWMWQKKGSSNHLTSIILKRHSFCKCCLWNVSQIDMLDVSHGYVKHSVCQVTAPPLDLKNWSSFIFTKIWRVFCRRGYLPYLTSPLIQQRHL